MSPSTNPSTSPSTSVLGYRHDLAHHAAAVVATPISGATTVHTGEPWAGSKPFVVVLIAFGLSLMGLGYFQRRRVAGPHPPPRRRPSIEST